MSAYQLQSNRPHAHIRAREAKEFRLMFIATFPLFLAAGLLGSALSPRRSSEPAQVRFCRGARRGEHLHPLRFHALGAERFRLGSFRAIELHGGSRHGEPGREGNAR